MHDDVNIVMNMSLAQKVVWYVVLQDFTHLTEGGGGYIPITSGIIVTPQI